MKNEEIFVGEESLLLFIIIFFYLIRNTMSKLREKIYYYCFIYSRAFFIFIFFFLIQYAINQFHNIKTVFSFDFRIYKYEFLSLFNISKNTIIPDNTMTMLIFMQFMGNLKLI